MMLHRHRSIVIRCTVNRIRTPLWLTIAESLGVKTDCHVDDSKINNPNNRYRRLIVMTNSIITTELCRDESVSFIIQLYSEDYIHRIIRVSNMIRHISLVVITGATRQVPISLVKSRQFI